MVEEQEEVEVKEEVEERSVAVLLPLPAVVDERFRLVVATALRLVVPFATREEAGEQYVRGSTTLNTALPSRSTTALTGSANALREPVASPRITSPGDNGEIVSENCPEELDTARPIAKESRFRRKSIMMLARGTSARASKALFPFISQKTLPVIVPLRTRVVVLRTDTVVVRVTVFVFSFGGIWSRSG